MRKKKEVTMQSIADILKISKVTVSKALGNKEGVSTELKLRILEVANELGYKTVGQEKEPQVQKSIAVMVRAKYVCESDYLPFYLKFYHLLSKALNRMGYICNLFTIEDKQENKKAVLELLIKSNMNGAIILGDIHKGILKEVKDLEIPMVFLDYYDSDNHIDCVLSDNYSDSFVLTNYLLRQGHQKIGFIGSISVTSSIQDRFLGYYKSLLEAKLSLNPDWIIADRDENNNSIQFVLPINMPTAFVCNCDDTAYRFISHLKKHGYKIPEDISVVGFDNDIYAELCEPKLTTIEVDMNLMANRAANLMIEKLDGKISDKQVKISVAGNIIYRDSVRGVSREYS